MISLELFSNFLLLSPDPWFGKNCESYKWKTLLNPPTPRYPPYSNLKLTLPNDADFLSLSISNSAGTRLPIHGANPSTRTLSLTQVHRGRKSSTTVSVDTWRLPTSGKWEVELCGGRSEFSMRNQHLGHHDPLVSFRYLVGQYVTIHDNVISHVNITNVEPFDGGLYTCLAQNSMGSVAHSARLNIYGNRFHFRWPKRLLAVIWWW